MICLFLYFHSWRGLLPSSLSRHIRCFIIKLIFHFIFSLGAGEIFRQWRDCYRQIFNLPFNLFFFQYSPRRTKWWSGKGALTAPCIWATSPHATHIKIIISHSSCTMRYKNATTIGLEIVRVLIANTLNTVPMSTEAQIKIETMWITKGKRLKQNCRSWTGLEEMVRYE